MSDTRVPVSRRAALGAAGAALVSCSQLPLLGGGGGSDGGDAPTTGASDGGAATPEPITTDGWAAREELETVELDVAAADATYEIGPGQFKRTDRYGSWMSPGFPQDGELFGTKPHVADGISMGQEVTQPISVAVAVHAILSVLDSPLAFEKDNSRHTEVSPELVKAFELDLDPHTFDEVFEVAPLTGAVDPTKGTPEEFGIEPAPYTADRPRVHVLEHAVHVRPLESGMEGDAVIATVRGVIPVTSDAGKQWLQREISFCLGLGVGADDGQVLMSNALNAGAAAYLKDPSVLPQIEIAAQVPEGSVAHRLGELSVQVPKTFGDPRRIETGLIWGEIGEDERGFSVLSYGLPAQSPYGVVGGDLVARFAVDGAEHVTATIAEQSDGGTVVRIRVHTKGATYSVQADGWPADEAPRLVHELVAGMKVSG